MKRWIGPLGWSVIAALLILLGIRAREHQSTRTLADLDLVAGDPVPEEMMGWGFAVRGMPYLIYVVGAAVAIGVVLARYLLPRMGEMLGGLIFEGAGQHERTKVHEAMAAVEAGKFPQARELYEAALVENPQDALACLGLANLHAEHLDDGAAAIALLEQGVAVAAAHDAARFLLRAADIARDLRQDPRQERALLERLVAQYPRTRFGSMAYERLRNLGG
jgi:tetratricopeptide (TPR) repeat protein